MTKFILLNDAATRVAEADIPLKLRGVQDWIERHPGLSMKIGDRRVIGAGALDLILDGQSLDNVAAKMRELNTGSPPDKGSTSGRE